MKNKTIANFLIATLALAFLAAMLETDYYALADIIYTIAGMIYLVFGIWASVRRYKLPN